MKKIYITLSAAIMLIIFYCSNIPNLHFVPDAMLPPWFQQVISASYIKFGSNGFFSYAVSLHPDFIIHKLGHITLYGLLGLFLLLATTGSGKWAIIITTLYATSDEFHQSFISGRSSRFGDIVLDVLSAVLFIVIWRKIAATKNYHNRTKR